MRKFFSISALLILLVATIGLSISKHYCGNILREVSYYVHNDGCGDMEMPMDCCNDENEVYQLHVDYQLTYSDIDFNADLLFITAYYAVYVAELTGEIIPEYYDHDPPPKPVARFVEYESFLL